MKTTITSFLAVISAITLDVLAQTSCPGTIYNNYCCVGEVDGPTIISLSSLASAAASRGSVIGSEASALSSSLATADASLSSVIASSISALASVAASASADGNTIVVPGATVAVPSGTVGGQTITVGGVTVPGATANGFTVSVPTVTFARRDATSIANGVLCYGVAVSISASDFNQVVASATSASAATPSAFVRASQATTAGVTVATSTPSSAAGVMVTPRPMALLGGAAVAVAYKMM